MTVFPCCWVDISLLFSSSLTIAIASDVWRDLCYHTTLDSSPRPYSDLHPQYLIESAGHVWDRYGFGDVAAEPQYIREAHYWEVRVVERWLRDFSSWQKEKRGV